MEVEANLLRMIQLDSVLLWVIEVLDSVLLWMTEELYTAVFWVTQLDSVLPQVTRMVFVLLSVTQLDPTIFREHLCLDCKQNNLSILLPKITVPSAHPTHMEYIFQSLFQSISSFLHHFWRLFICSLTWLTFCTKFSMSRNSSSSDSFVGYWPGSRSKRRGYLLPVFLFGNDRLLLRNAVESGFLDFSFLIPMRVSPANRWQQRPVFPATQEHIGIYIGNNCLK